MYLVYRFEGLPPPGGGFVGLVKPWPPLYRSGLRFVKSFIGVSPRSTPTIGHLPPFEVCSSLCRSRKVLLCRLILSLDVVLHPPRMCVLLICEWHFVHVSGGPCFLLHLCT